MSTGGFDKPHGSPCKVPCLLCDGLSLALVADVDEAVEGLLARGEDSEDVAVLEVHPRLQEVHAGILAAHL